MSTLENILTIHSESIDWFTSTFFYQGKCCYHRHTDIRMHPPVCNKRRVCRGIGMCKWGNIKKFFQFECQL